MALTRNKPRTYSAAELGAQPLADSTVVYEGACMGVHAATGRVRALVSGDLFAGFARQKVDSTTLVGGQAASTVPLAASGTVELAVSGATATSLGASVYATDDDTFSLTGGSLVGTVVRVPATGLVECKFAALATADFPALKAALPVAALWANRAALLALGVTTAFFTDVGIGGSVWSYSGSRWRPYLGRVRLKSLVTDVSNNGAPKVVLDYATLLAGIWQDGDTIECSVIKERTGGTSDTDATDVMLGTVPTTLGTTLNLSTSGLATTQISMSTLYKWRRVSSTSVRSQSVAGTVGFGNSTSANSLITGLANLDSVETYLQVTSDLTTAGGEVAWLRGFTVDLIAGA